MTTKFESLSLGHLIRKENEGHTATEERTLRFERQLRDLERRLTDLECVLWKNNWRKQSTVSSIPPYVKGHHEIDSSKNRIIRPTN